MMDFTDTAAMLRELREALTPWEGNTVIPTGQGGDIRDPAQLPKIDGFWYLATPYSKFHLGLAAASIEASKLAGEMIRAGKPVFSPIAHSHPIAVYSGIDPLDHGIWLPADHPLMVAAGGLVVAVRMEGWSQSHGIQVEIKEFTMAGKPVYYWR